MPKMLLEKQQIADLLHKRRKKGRTFLRLLCFMWFVPPLLLDRLSLGAIWCRQEAADETSWEPGKEQAPEGAPVVASQWRTGGSRVRAAQDAPGSASRGSESDRH